jgi:hypothetical protein
MCYINRSSLFAIDIVFVLTELRFSKKVCPNPSTMPGWKEIPLEQVTVLAL